MKVYLLYELEKYPRDAGDNGYLMSVWSMRKGAEQEAKRLEWRACPGYKIVEMDVHE